MIQSSRSPSPQPVRPLKKAVTLPSSSHPEPPPSSKELPTSSSFVRDLSPLSDVDNGHRGPSPVEKIPPVNPKKRKRRTILGSSDDEEDTFVLPPSKNAAKANVQHSVPKTAVKENVQPSSSTTDANEQSSPAKKQKGKKREKVPKSSSVIVPGTFDEADELNLSNNIEASPPIPVKKPKARKEKQPKQKKTKGAPTDNPDGTCMRHAIAVLLMYV